MYMCTSIILSLKAVPEHYGTTERLPFQIEIFHRKRRLHEPVPQPDCPSGQGGVSGQPARGA